MGRVVCMRPVRFGVTVTVQAVAVCLSTAQ